MLEPVQGAFFARSPWKSFIKGWQFRSEILLFESANVVPSQFATAFPQKAVGARSPNNRHRNSLLVGLTRSPLAGPSSFLELFILIRPPTQVIHAVWHLRICLS